MKIAGIILASGNSRRMGENKYHLPLGQQEVYQYAVSLLQKLPLTKRFIVTNDPQMCQYCRKMGVETVANPLAAEGKASSIRAGVTAAGDVDGYLFMTADQPLVSLATCRQILEAQKTAPDHIIQPVYAGTRGMPVCIPASYKESLLQLKGEQGGKNLMTPKNTLSVRIQDGREHQDIDTAEDYRLLQQWLQEREL